MGLQDFLYNEHFNSRPRKEVDGTGGLFSPGASGISTHDLARRSTDINPEDPDEFVFQLTTSQGGRRLPVGRELSSMGISTHDLARRSTAIFTQKVFLSKSLFVLIAYNIFILY